MNVDINRMEVTRAYKFRIYPDAKRQLEIDERLILAQQLYNRLLEKSIDAYKNGKTKVSMAQFNRFVKEIIQEDQRFMKLYSQTRCEIEYRLMKAYQNFFRRIKSGERRKGFPRFRSQDRYKSITYPQDNGSFSIEKNRLRVSRIGTMKIELHRSIEGTIKTLSIKKNAGDYYAIFSTIQEIEIPRIKNTNPVGIDVGLETFATLSNGTKIQKPNFARKREKKLARWQRIVARKEKGSKNREKAKLKLSKSWQEVNNQTDDYLHKITNQLINSEYTSFAVEKLNIKNMVRNHNLARSIYNASWNKFIQILTYKAESAGMEVIPVVPADTTRTCSNCRNVQDVDLDERIYICNRCGMQKDRDINAAINILEKAREGHSRSNASGDAISTIQKVSQVASVNQEHTLQPMAAEEAHTVYGWEGVTTRQ